MPSLFNHIKLRGLLISHHNVDGWGESIEKSLDSRGEGENGARNKQKKKKRKVFCFCVGKACTQVGSMLVESCCRRKSSLQPSLWPLPK